MTQRIVVTIVSANGLYTVRVVGGRDGRASGTLTCTDVTDAVGVVKQRLEATFVSGDKIQFASMLFNSVSDAVRAVEISTGVHE